MNEIRVTYTSTQGTEGFPFVVQVSDTGEVVVERTTNKLDAREPVGRFERKMPVASIRPIFEILEDPAFWVNDNHPDYDPGEALYKFALQRSDEPSTTRWLLNRATKDSPFAKAEALVEALAKQVMEHPQFAAGVHFIGPPDAPVGASWPIAFSIENLGPVALSFSSPRTWDGASVRSTLVVQQNGIMRPGVALKQWAALLTKKELSEWRIAGADEAPPESVDRIELPPGKHLRLLFSVPLQLPVGWYVFKVSTFTSLCDADGKALLSVELVTPKVPIRCLEA